MVLPTIFKMPKRKIAIGHCITGHRKDVDKFNKAVSRSGMAVVGQYRQQAIIKRKAGQQAGACLLPLIRIF